jgi:hypothetical protein
LDLRVRKALGSPTIFFSFQNLKPLPLCLPWSQTPKTTPRPPTAGDPNAKIRKKRESARDLKTRFFGRFLADFLKLAATFQNFGLLFWFELSLCRRSDSGLLIVKVVML